MPTQSDRILVEVLPEPLQLTKYTEFVADPGAGAVATFSGVTRDNFEGKNVLKLEYEAYAPMAEKVMLVRPSLQWPSRTYQFVRCIMVSTASTP
jgi:molybdopterin synthase catalytic subunit